MRVCLVIALSEYNQKKINFFKNYYIGKFNKVIFCCQWLTDPSLLTDEIRPMFYAYNQWYRA